MDDDNRDSLDITPEVALKEAVTDHCQGKEPPSKALVILLWDENPGAYTTAFYNAGMKTSEVIALLEFTKHRFLRIMYGESE